MPFCPACKKEVDSFLAHVVEAHSPYKEKKQMKIRPLHDRLIVRRDQAKNQTEGGIYIPDNAKEVPIQGEVLAVGTGRVAEDGTVRPLAVKAGDLVLFSKYAGTEIPLLGENCIMLREEDVLGVIVEAG